MDMVGVAQLVELRIVIPVVVGSIPIAHPIFSSRGLKGTVYLIRVDNKRSTEIPTELSKLSP
jgi:hypothetical protein